MPCFELMYMPRKAYDKKNNKIRMLLHESDQKSVQEESYINHFNIIRFAILNTQHEEAHQINGWASLCY